MSPTNDRGSEWAAPWVAKKLSMHEEVAGTAAGTGSVVTVERKRLPQVQIGCVSVQRFDTETVEKIIAKDPSLQFIVNVKKDAVYTGAALDAADEHGIAVGGMGDLMRALRDMPNLADYVNPDTTYIERGLAQHHCVEHVERLARGCYRLHTLNGDLVTLAVGREYEVTAEAVRQAIANHGLVDAVVTANPNARPIAPNAAEAGSSANVKVLLWQDFYGRLNGRWT